jgi:hypothetical protein
MTETAADEQDLAKALDSVANATSRLDSTGTVQPSGSVNPLGELPPIIPPNSPVAPTLPTYPAITPIHDSNDRPPVQSAAPTISVTPTPVLSSPSDDNSVVPAADPLVDPESAPENTPDVSDAPVISPVDDVVVESGPLADIKKDALDELRPLVDKLDVNPEEKFDTYLLLIRSTDDTNLVGPAHEAAKSITDEAKRAEALLEIIKEIDYLSRKK